MAKLNSTNTMHISRRSFLYGGAAVFAAAGLGLAGCSNSKKDTLSSDAKIKGALSYSTTNYEVVGQTNALMMAVDWHVYEGLYEIDYHTYQPYPALAAGEPTKIDEYTYSIKIRDNAKFSDGSAVTNKDVVASIGANMTNSTYRSYLDFLKSVSEGSSSNEVIVHTKYPFESLLMNRLAIPKIYEVKANPSDASSLKTGSGPWRLDEIHGEDGGYVAFSPNPHYNGSKPVAKDKMFWNVLLDATARTTAISEKTTYAIENCPDSNVDNVKNSGATVDYEEGLSMGLLIFNCLKEPFTDKRVRQAIFYAINTQQMIDNQLNGHAKPSTCLLPENHQNYHRASTVYTYDKDKAKKLLQEAGKENFTMELWVGPTWVKELAPQIKNDLAEVGITCNIRSEAINWDSLAESDNVLPFDMILNAGDPGAFGNDPDLVMNVWHGDNIWNHGRTCWAKSPNSRYNELQLLLAEARSTTGATQQNLWNQCYDIIADQVTLYPMFHRSVATAYLPSNLENYKPIATTGLDFIGATGK